MYKLIGIILTVLFFLLMASPAWAQTFSITKDDKPNTVDVGEPITYTLTVTNSAAAGVATIKDTLPKEVKYLGTDSNCTESDHAVTCTTASIPTSGSATIKLFVQAKSSGDAKNVAKVGILTGTTFTEQNHDDVTTHINKKDASGGSDGSGGKGNPPGDRNGDGRISQSEEALNAAEDLNSVDESTDGENTSSSLDASDSANDSASANADENGAEASTPGAIASANGDEDTSGPVGPQGDVMNDIPESGPLPNTGGISLLALAMPVLGVMLLGATLFARWKK